MMPSVGMLVNLWKEDGFDVFKVGEEIDDINPKLKWELWQVESNVFYSDYGRHGILRILLVRKNRQIVEHECINISQRQGQNINSISRL